MKLNPSKPILTAGRPAQRGIALVITLIMLSVTLIMAVAFLAVANRERATVTITSDGVNARLAADSALAAAQAQIMANVLGSGGGLYNSALIVSTNYIRYQGFVPGLPNLSPTNVNYDYYFNSPSRLTPGDFETVVASLLYLPRAPVMLSSNEPDGRFYLDLNRNGVFEPTGTNIVFVDTTGASNINNTVSEIGDPQWIGVLQRPDALHSADNQFIARYAFLAQPIGNGLDLNYIHNQVKNQGLGVSDGFFRNQGVGSWEINLAAFLADLNANEWDSNTVPSPFYYSFQQPTSANSGVAFDDARSLLSWRYGFNYSSLASAAFMFANTASPFKIDYIDEYSDGPLQTNTANIDEFSQPDDISQSWAGADNTNRFFNLPAELFDPTKSSVNFTNRLTAASTRFANGAQPTYDRYTYYRMLQQMGTDSTADDDGKLDLNYDNTDGHGNVVRGVQTNLVPWTALSFFTNAADRMLRMYTTNWFQSGPSNYLATYYNTNYNYYYTYNTSSGSVVVTNDPNGFGLTNVPFFGMTNQIPAFGIANIPVLISNTLVYSPAVNRILQLAANIYDASTNNFFPSVFRPIFTRNNDGNVFITGYQQIVSVSPDIVIPSLATSFSVLADPLFITDLPLNTTTSDRNVYGIPWIIGAKKYLPNFNQVYMHNDVSVTRKLEVTRDNPNLTYSGNSSHFQTNQMFIMGITNHIGYSLWNSYVTNYPGGPIDIVVKDTNRMELIMTNAQGTITVDLLSQTNFLFAFSTNSWPGSGWASLTPPSTRQAAPGSFIHGTFDFAFLPESAYQYDGTGFIPTSLNPQFYTNPVSVPLFPGTGLSTTNGLQAYIIDETPPLHVIDYVNFNGHNSFRRIDMELADPYPMTPLYQMWYTNAYKNSDPPWPSLGVMDQIAVSKTGPIIAPQTGNNEWKVPPNMPPGLAVGGATTEAEFFSAFFNPTAIIYNGNTYYNTNLVQQAPYTPTRLMFDVTLWQANDPLVHYLASDLSEIVNGVTGLNHIDDPTMGLPSIEQNTLDNVKGKVVGDDRYQPWGRNGQFSKLQNVDENVYNLAYRDPLVYSPDSWDFPTNRYPSIGWLGRVHRGTPWQTVYLKATNILQLSINANPPVGYVTWTNWLGDVSFFDAQNSAPVQDDVLFDIFTTALDDNASRGTLSVNQQNLAAWSALLSGTTVIANSTPGIPNFDVQNLQTNIVIDPAGLNTVNSLLWQIVEGTNGINATRTNLFANGAFAHIGDIVRVPALSQQSPFLNLIDANHQEFDVSDEEYEWIPQQILGLLRVGSPRYVIYCYGQALRPAQDGVALDLTHNGLVTNYQVVAESAARAVVSVHPQVVYRPPAPPVTNYTTTVENYTPLTPN